MSVQHVKKGDTVKILTGKDKGGTGKVSAVNPEDGRVIVDNKNIIIKHLKPVKAKSRGSGSRGGIEKIAGSIDASNVQVICPECKKPTRVAHAEKADAKGKIKRYRACKKCGASLDLKAVKADKKDKKKKKEDGGEEKKTKKTGKSAKPEKPEKTDNPEKLDKMGRNADGAVV